MAKMTAKKALLTSILSLLVCVTMLVGTTFAWFTDSVTSGTNRIIAGNLDVEVYHTSASVATAETVEGKTNLFRNDDGEAMLWEPGAVSYENLTVKNIGTLAFKYAINMNVTDYNAVNGTDKTLLDVLKVKILKGEDIITAIDRASILALDWSAEDVQTLGEFTDSDELYPVGNVPTGEASEKAFQIIVYWQPTANDNDYNLNNGKKSTDETPLFIEFGINLVAAQFTYENDSFGNDYDDGTSLPALPVTINKTFKSAAVNHNDTLDPNETVKIVNAKNVTVAELESTSAQAIIDQVNMIITDKDPEKDVNTVFTLNIETTEVKEDSVTYEIDLNAVTTYTTNSDVTATQTLTKEQVNTALAAANKLVVAEVNIGAGLHDVTVKHSGVAMSPLASAAEDAEGYYYDITTGKLTIKTKSFSPFTIEYRTEYAAKVGETYYMSAEKAFKAATASDTVVFLSDCKLNVANIPVEINFDLNGKTLDLGSRGTVSKTYDGNSTALKYFAGGFGTEEKPFLISNANQWNSFYQAVYDLNSVNVVPQFKIKNDIDLDGIKIKNYAINSNEEKVAEFYMTFILDGGNKSLNNIEGFGGYCQILPYLKNTTVKNVTFNYDLNETRTSAMSYSTQGNVYFDNVEVKGNISTTANWATAFVAYSTEGNIYYTNCVNRANIKGGFGNNAYVAAFGSHNGGGVHITFDNCKNYGGLMGGYVGFVGMGNDSAYTFVDENAVQNYGNMVGTKNSGYFRYDYSSDNKTIGGVTCIVKRGNSEAKKSTTHSDSAPSTFGDSILINAVEGAVKYEVEMSFAVQVYNYTNIPDKWSGGFPRSIKLSYTADDVVNGKITTSLRKCYVGEIKADKYYGYGNTTPTYNDGVFVPADFDLKTANIVLNQGNIYLVEDNGDYYYVFYDAVYHGWYSLLTTNTSGEITSTQVTVSFSVTAYNPDGSVLSFSSFNYGSPVSEAKAFFNE